MKGVEGPKGAGLEQGLPLEASGLGWTGKQAVFTVSSQRPDQQVLLVDPSDGKSRWAPSLDQTDQLCVVGGELLAVSTGEIVPGGGSSSPNPDAVAEPLRTLSFNSDLGRWTRVSEMKKPASTGAMFERVYCSGDQLVYLPIMPPPAGFAGGGLQWDTATNTWKAIPSLGGIGFPGDVRVASANGALVLWPLDSDTMFVRERDAAAWEQLQRPPDVQSPFSLSAGPDVVIVDETAAERPPAPLALGFLDPIRFAEAAR